MAVAGETATAMAMATIPSVMADSRVRFVVVLQVCRTRAAAQGRAVSVAVPVDQDTPTRVPIPPTPDDAAIDAHVNRFAGF